MRLCSFVCLFFSFFAFSDDNFNQAIIKAGQAIENCNLEAKNNLDPFPTNHWFNGLSIQERKLVVGFISLDNMNNCSYDEMERLRQVSKNFPDAIQQQMDGFSLFENGTFGELIKSLDIEKVRKIQSVYSKPFDTFRVMDELGL